MNSLEHQKKTFELISKFKNGKERYKKSALFNRVVQSMVRGCEPLEIIEQLIDITEDTQKAFEVYINRDTRPFLMNLES